MHKPMNGQIWALLSAAQEKMNIFDKFKQRNSTGLFSFSLSKEQLQGKIEKQFPKTCEKYFCSVSALNPNIVLNDDSERIGMELNVTIKVPLAGEKSGGIVVDGDIFFDRDTGSVFITNPKILRLDVPGMPDKFLAPITQIATSILEDQLKKSPIYEVGGGVPLRTIKSVLIKDGKLTIGIGI